MAGNKIPSNLSSLLGPGEVVVNSSNSDWSCKRCLTFSLNDDGDDEMKVFTTRRGRVALSLNGDVDEELEDFSRRGRSSNGSHPDAGCFEESFNLLLSSIGGEVGARCLLEASGVVKDSAADDAILGLAGKIHIIDVSLSLISVNILEF